ncbi:energy transducer TonB [Stutzerimonas stutzeri]|uniref:Protein TonB n=1 Tax=Stutzerimonas stutzeri TaxID=316 RepID=A0A2N8T4Y9_STUST|nr:energy transducer TonB [Stutzerimonas stutzeri]MCQ4324083.1 TonB family protein [Stutzerimonas stutzeri]PNG09782.1 energy transducer TonB [Stutzerimonas stutzeri]
MASLTLDAVRNAGAVERRWPGDLAAALLAVGLHAGLFALLLHGWTPELKVPAASQVLATQLVSLPQPPAEPVVEPLAESPVEPAPAQVRPAEPAPDPRIEQHRLEQAELALARAEQARSEQRRREQQRQREERQRQEAERERQRQVREARQQAERARLEAEAAERARLAAEAASRQYLPIAKQPPSYPQRALDMGLQGECTVSYRVDRQGRVESPKVVGDCHPLFIRPSLAAAKTFRYQPRIVDGRAVAVPDVRNTFHYRIE